MSPRHLIILLILLCSGIVLKAQNFNRVDATSATYIDSVMAAEMAAENMVGASLAVIKNGQIVYLKGYGWADQELGQPATVNTMYRVASISKVFTAVSALQLVDSNLLSLSDDVRTHVPEYPDKGFGTIEVQHILSNESGIQHYSQVNSYDWVARDNYIIDHLNDYDPVAAIDVFKNQPALFTPGSQYNYSTFAFNLAAAVVERAGAAPFEQQIKSRIVDVADMPFFQLAIRGNRHWYEEAAGYETVGNVAVPHKGGNSDFTDVSWKAGGGGFVCTVRDLAHFATSYLAGNLLSKAMQDTMSANHDPSNGSNYGYGISTGSYGGDSLLWHSGSQAWCKTLIGFSPENETGVVVMTNNRDANQWAPFYPIYDEIPNMTITGPAYVNPVVSSLASATLVSPADAISGVPTQAVVSWTAVPYADSYDIEYDTDPGFGSSSIWTVRDSITAVIAGLQPSTTYYWRVTARNDYLYGGLTAAASASRSFTTGPLGLPVTLPFIEDFEDFHQTIWRDEVTWRQAGYQWSYEADTDAARAKFGKWSIANNGGYGAMTMDAMSTNGVISNTNYLTLTLDLSNYGTTTDLALDFDFVQHGEESDNEDRVWIRGDSNASWIQVYDWYANRGANGAWVSATGIDIDTLLIAGGQSPSSTFQLRFGQSDNSYASNSTSLDGVTFDNIRITGTLPPLSIDPSSSFPDLDLAESAPSIYPNPNNGEFTISPVLDEFAVLEILDTRGQVVYQRRAGSGPEIKIQLDEGIANGIYTLRIRGNAQIRARKIVVLR